MGDERRSVVLKTGSPLWNRRARRRAAGLRVATKRLAVPAAVLLLCAAGTPHARAEGPPPVSVLLDGRPVAGDVAPYIAEGRVMVPVRSILEPLGATVEWDGDRRMVRVVKGSLRIEIPVGQRGMYRNGERVETDVPSALVQGRTMVPVRSLAEILGAKVEWDGDHRRVLVTTAGGGAGGASPGLPARTGGGDLNGAAAGPVSRPVWEGLLEVKGAEAGVPADQIERVRRLLARSGVMDHLTSDLPGSLREPVRIYLVSTPEGFRRALVQAGLPPEQANLFASLTSGASLGNDIYIPLYAAAEDAHLANVLAHELTHVFLDQTGAGQAIPVWMHEGLAWWEGLKAQSRFEPAVVSKGWPQRLEAAIIDGQRRGVLIPLPDVTQDSILGISRYNPEWQGYVAVERLAGGGWDRIRRYIAAARDGVPDAFVRAFGMTEEAFDRQLREWLEQQGRRADAGVRLTLQVEPGFSGNIGFMAHGSDHWLMFRLAPGTYQVEILPDGSVTGLSGGRTVRTANGADPNTMFIGIQPDRPGSGDAVEGGFAISYAYGRYFYQNAWTRKAGEGPKFNREDRVLGVRLVDIQPEEAGPAPAAARPAGSAAVPGR